MANSQFQLSGNAAERYEQSTVPTMAGPVARAMLANIDLTGARRILDAACGTGVVVRLVAEGGISPKEIVGVDLNENMLEVARNLEPDAAFPIAWQQGDLCALPFAEEAFDVVLCNQGLQFPPDKGLALSEIKRVLEKGGRFIFTVWSAAPPINVAIADSISRHVGESLAETFLNPFAFRDIAVIRELLNDAGFGSLDCRELTALRQTPASEDIALNIIDRSHIAADISAERQGVRDLIAREVYEAISGYKDGDIFSEPMSNHLVQVRKPVS